MRRSGSHGDRCAVYKLPDTGSRRLGYVRLGGIVNGTPIPVTGKGCTRRFLTRVPDGLRVHRRRHDDLDAPMIRASSAGPTPLEATSLQVRFRSRHRASVSAYPNTREQEKSEVKLGEPHAVVAEHKAKCRP